MNWIDDATPQDLYEAGLADPFEERVSAYDVQDLLIDHYFLAPEVKDEATEE